MMQSCLKFLFLLASVAMASNDTVSFFFDFLNSKLDTQRENFVSDDFSEWKDKENQGKISLNYCAPQDFDKAYAEIVDAPNLAGKKALHYVVREPNNVDALGKPLKGRIQNEFNVKKGFRSFTNEVDIYFPLSMNKVKEFEGAVSFFSLQEQWNDSHDKPSTFKITLRMSKQQGLNQNLFFLLTADDYYKTGRHRVASFRDSLWSIPIGEWFSLRTEINEGSGENGHVKISVKRQDDEFWTIVFDKEMQTKSAAYIGTGILSKGFRSIQSLKFYMTKALVDFFKENNTPLEIYYTNWKFVGVR